MRFIIGLGNPGEKYQDTRHNTGFMAVDYLAEQKGLSWQFNKKFNAQVAKADDLILVKPQTFMNSSGQAARVILDYYKLLPKKLGLFAEKNIDLSSVLTVIHDDVDFALGVFKTQTNRSAGGHNGVNSIITHLKTQNFTRIRVGIKRETRLTTEKFVLEKFSREEKEELKKILPAIADSIFP